MRWGKANPSQSAYEQSSVSVRAVWVLQLNSPGCALSVYQKRNYPPGSLPKYQLNSLRFCHLILQHHGFLRQPSVCLSTHRTHTALSRTRYSYSWLDGGFSRSGTWVSTFTEGKWKLPNTLERDGRGGLNNILATGSCMQSWLHEEAVTQLCILHLHHTRCEAHHGRHFFHRQPVTVSWNITEALHHMELPLWQSAGTRK